MFSPEHLTVGTRISPERPNPPARILLIGFSPDQRRTVEYMAPNAEFVAATENTVLQVAAEVDAIVALQRVLLNQVFSAELLRLGTRLRWIHLPGAGIDEYLIPEFAASRITVTNGRIIQGPEVADHAMALLLALTRNLHRVIADGSDGTTPRPIELRGKTALVIGLGGVGVLIAERAVAFGMQVIGVTAGNMPLLRMLERVYQPEQLLEALAHADVVFLAAPLTPATRGMLGDQQFAAMKPSAYVINVSRGRTVRTDALVRALEQKRLAGAGLDVTDPEPLPHDHPLRRFKHVVITPHIAGLSDHNWERGVELACTNIQRFLQGWPLLNVVDKTLGY